MSTEKQTQYFYELTPDKVLQAVELLGEPCTGYCVALNSYENRVYEIELDLEVERHKKRKVVKFYRPGRWSREQILEEHRFLLELEESEIPVVAPVVSSQGETLHSNQDGTLFFAVFKKTGGRVPDELSDEQCVRVGRLMARIHATGNSKPFTNRWHLGVEKYLEMPLAFLKENRLMAMEFESRFEKAVQSLMEIARKKFQGIKTLRIHGDCHAGNLLFGDQGFFFLDFDDTITGPAVQDFWLLLGGRDEHAKKRLKLLLEGYESMRVFDRKELGLIEILRAMRWVHFCGWIARRWEDPAFPHAFPHFGTPKYWSELVNDLEDQVRRCTSETEDWSVG